MINERLACGSSLLHRGNPKDKIIGTSVLVLMLAVTGSMPCMVTGLGVGILFVYLGKIDAVKLKPRFVAVNIFILFLWVTLPLTAGGAPLFTLGPLAVSEKGVLMALQITIKANAIMLITLALLSTTPILQIGRSLQNMGLSRKLVMLLLTTYRYLTVIEQEFRRLRVAASLRCFQPKSNLHTYRTYSHLIGMTLVLSWERSHRIHRAMIMRGFDGHNFPILEPGTPSGRSGQLIFLLVASSLLLAFLSVFF